MRIFAALLLIVATVLMILGGGSYYLSSMVKKENAKIIEEAKANTLSTVSADLVSPEELAKMRAAEAKKKATQSKTTKSEDPGARHRLVAIFCFIVAFFSLVSVVLILLNKLKLFSRVVLLVGALWSLTANILERGPLFLVITLIAYLLAIVCFELYVRRSIKKEAAV